MGDDELFEEVHEWLARLLVTVAIVHASAALYHHFGRRDDVLRRMLPFTGAVLLLILTAGGAPAATAWRTDAAEVNWCSAPCRPARNSRAVSSASPRRSG